MSLKAISGLPAITAVTGLVLAVAFGPAAAKERAPHFDQLLPHIPVVAPEASLKLFQVEPGFRVELAAAEPNVADPVDIAFDEHGRMYVCELWNYPGVPKPGEPLGRIRLLSSSHNDGLYDRSTIFADNLRWPSGIICWNGGVYVISNPDIWYLKDTTGTGVADVREKVFTGLAGQTYEVANSLRWGLDNRIYVCGSYAGGSLRRAGDRQIPQHARRFRFDPRTNTCEPVSGGGEWGATFNDWGDAFTCDATHMAFHTILPREDLAQNPYLAVSSVQEQCIPEWTHVFPVSKPEPWKVVRQDFWNRWVNTNHDMNAGRFPRTELAPQGFATSACGLTIYRGSAFPKDYRGNGFIGEPANNVVVRLQFDEQDGPSVTARRPAGNESREFLASADNRFRPVNLANGPDGCLYVISMYREIIEDETAIPDDILKHYDLTSGRDLGRIYRVVPLNFRRPPLPDFAAATAQELAKRVGDDSSWVRETAQRLLYQKQDRSAIEPLRQLANSGASPQGRIQALWTLEGLGGLDDSSVLAAAGDADPHVREQALILARPLLSTSANVREKVFAMADDPSGRVRFRVALTLAYCAPETDVAAVAMKLARHDCNDQWMRSAIAAGVPRQSGALAARLLADVSLLDRAGASELIGLLAESAGARHDRDDVAALLEGLSSPAVLQKPALAVTLLRQLAEGLARGGSSLPEMLDGMGSGQEGAGRALASVFASAAKTAADQTLPSGQRAEAVKLMAHAPFDRANATLEPLLDPSQPVAVQLAAVRALSAHSDPRVAPALLGHWAGFGPAARQEVIEALFRRPDRLPALLDSIEAGKFPAAQLVPGRRNALLNNPDRSIRARAAKLLGAAASPDKQQLVERYRTEVLKLTGDEARGRVVFQNTCAVCHKPEQGQAPGPNLAVLEDRSPGTLLVAILDPNREVKPSYVSFVLDTKDGQSYSGVIVNETATSVTLRHPGGSEDTVLRGNITSLRSTNLSLMPDGLESGINYQQMADLLRFLATMK